MLSVIISPSKSMVRVQSDSNLTQPIHLDHASKIMKELKKFSIEDLKTLMAVSDKIAAENYERFKKYSFKDQDLCSPAILSYTGDVYSGLDATSFTKQEFQFASKTIYIISGLFGILRAFDGISPYRLEMQQKGLKIGSLYKFWQDQIYLTLRDEMKNNKSTHLVNLASDEYYKTIKPFIDDTMVTHVEFYENKNNKLSFVSTFAKKARGLMARYIVKTKARTIKDLKKFDYEGYRYSEEKSEGNKLVFLRG